MGYSKYLVIHLYVGKNSIISPLSEKNESPTIKNIQKSLLVQLLFHNFALANQQGAIAQLVEQRTENPCVPGSIPGGTT